jgi:nitrite reductase/ring-hydroxylating ferredoxin subunit
MTVTADARHAFDIGDVSEYPEGTHKVLDVGGRSIGVYCTHGKLYAVQNLCPHALAPIALGELQGTMLPSRYGEFEYGLEGLVLRCMWHGWEFDIRSGETVCGTDRRRLVSFPVVVEDDRVLVTLRPKGREAASSG